MVVKPYNQPETKGNDNKKRDDETFTLNELCHNSQQNRQSPTRLDQNMVDILIFIGDYSDSTPDNKNQIKGKNTNPEE